MICVRQVITAARRNPDRRPRAMWHALLLLLLLLPLGPLAPGRATDVAAAGEALAGAGNAAVRNGRIEVDGQPFFPFGFYYVSWSQSDAQMIDTLRTVAAAGFNTMHVSLESGNDRGAFYDEAARLGVRLIAEGVTASEIPALKAKPAALGWNIGDDVHTNISPAGLAQRHAAVKAADPNHLTYFTVYDANTWGPYLDKGDLVAPYSYPINWGGVAEVDKAINAARPAGRPMIGIPQAFNWQGDRAPTPAEARNMTYQYLVNGVQGMVMYNYNEYGQPLPTTHPALWNEYKALVPEIGALAPALTSGTFAKLDTGVSGVLAARWSHGGQTYMVVLNTGEGGARQVSLPLPTGATGAARPLFAGRPSGLVASNGRLSGTINPQDVHVYAFGAGTASPSPGPSTAPPAPPVPSPSPSPTPTTPSVPSPSTGACPTGQWRAEFFANTGLNGGPTTTRCDRAIDFAWNGAAPAPGVGPDNFSARWAGQFDLAAGQTTFTATTDDGMRVWLDGTLILDKWTNQPATTHTVTVPTTAGAHQLKVEYYNGCCGSVAKLAWQTSGCQVGQWRAEYFNNKTLAGTPTLTRCESKIAYDWGNTSPAAGIQADGFSVRWTGQFDFAAGRYTFTGRADDGVRAFLDGAQVLSGWRNQAATTYTGTRDVGAGRHEVRVEYYDNVAPASITFGWASSAARAASAIFPDVPGDDPSHEALTGLAALGIARGYADGRFGVADPALRAQMAALLTRAAGWDGEDRGTAFTDQGTVDAALWRNVGALAARGVARGYPGGTFDPTGPVLQAQAVSFVTRAMVARGWWTPQADDAARYANMTDPGHRADLATFVAYAGALPDLATDEDWRGWDTPCTRGWFARVLWQALLTVNAA